MIKEIIFIIVAFLAGMYGGYKIGTTRKHTKR